MHRAVKTVEDRITKFSPHGSLIPLVLWVKFQEILMGPPPSAGTIQGGVGENQPFSSFKHQYLENGNMAKVTINN